MFVSSRWLALAIPFLALACSGGGKKESGAAAESQFDLEWKALASQGAEVLYIEDDRGEGLMGNVRRSRTPADPMGAQRGAVDPQRPLPVQPSGDEVQKVIRQNLAGVKGCYMRMTRDGVTRSGKAIVSFKIGADGQVGGLKVDAPSFDGTPLPDCVTGQVTHWAFSKSQKGGLAVSYPFVFVGG